MRLKTLSFKGITVFKEPVAIDFAALGAGLIAVTGPNGAGKSTMVESCLAALYREMPTRGALIKSCSGKDAYVDLAYDMDGIGYKSKIILDAVTGKQEAYLEADGVPVPGVNGKLGPYDAEIEKRIGSKKLLLSSVFSAQNRRGAFHEMAVADRKSLFIELLGIGQYPVLCEKAGRSQLAVSLDLQRAVGQRESIERELSAVAGLLERLSDAQLAGTEANDALAVAIDDEKRLREEHRQASETCVRLTTELQGLRSNYADKERGLLAEKEKTDTAIATRKRDLAVAAAYNATKLAEIETQLADARLRLDNNQKLAAKAPEIIAAELTLAGKKQQLEALDQEWESAITAEQNLSRIKSDLVSAKGALAMTEQTIQHWRDSVKDLQDVPCEGKGVYAGCAKIVTAVEHKNALPGKIDQANQQKDAVAALEKRAGDTGCRLSKTIAGERAGIQADIKKLSESAKYAEAVKIAPDRVKELTSQIDGLEHAKKDLGNSSDPAKDPLLMSLNETLGEINTNRFNLQAERSKLIEMGDNETMAGQERDRLGFEVEKVVIKIGLLRTNAARLETETATLSAEITRLEAKQPEFEALRGQETTLRRDLEDWTVLGAALGSKGLPALLIDNAGPAISELTNTLLSECYGNRFTLTLATQRLNAAGDRLIEDFAIKIADHERGREGSIEDLSGGEKVIVSEALSLGIALSNKGTSKHSLDTLFRDETVGALDQDNAVRFAAMMRKAMKLGGFHQCLLVVHNAEVAALCDARLQFAGGKVTVDL